VHTYRIPNFVCQNHLLRITSFKTIIRVLDKNMAQSNSNFNQLDENLANSN